MYSESQNVAVHSHFGSNNSLKQNTLENDIDDYINNVLTDEIDSTSIDYNLLRHYSRSGHADTLYQSIIQKLPSFFKNIVFNQLLNFVDLDCIIQIFESLSKRLDLISNIFEGSKYYLDNKERKVFPRAAYKILKQNILSDEKIYQLLANIFSDLYMKFRHQTFDSDEKSFFNLIQIVNQIKIGKEFSNFVVPAIASDFPDALPTESGSIFLSSLTKILNAEIEKLSNVPPEFKDAIILPVRILLYSKTFECNIDKFTDELLSSKNLQLITLLSTLVNELHDLTINDKFIEALSVWTINKSTSIINQNSVSCIPELMDLFFLFQTLVKTHHINQTSFCLKYFKGCLLASSNKITYLASRYIHQQIQQNNGSFNQQIPDLLNFLLELDSVPYLFSCFRQFLGLRTLNYFPEKFMSDSELFNQIGIIFSIDQKNLLSQMYPDLKESSAICSEFKSSKEIPIAFRIMVMSVEKWPSYPQFPLKVDDEILTIRNEFETFYTSKFPNKEIRWINSLETCVFTYQGYNIIAFTVQYVILKFLKDGKDLNETGIPKEYQSEIFNSLIRCGILTRKNGRYAFLKLRQPQKTIRINTITINYPEKIPEKDDKTIFFSQRKKISANIMIALKKKNELSYSKLYRKTQDLLDFPLSEISFKNCLSGLLAQQMIIKGNDKIYRYFPI